MRILARVRWRRRILDHVHHLPQGPRGVSERPLARRGVWQDQKIEEALASHRPRPCPTQALTLVLLPVNGRLAKRPTRIGPRLERAVKVIERSNGWKVLTRRADRDPGPNRLSIDGERSSSVNTVLALQDRVEIRSIHRDGPEFCMSCRRIRFYWPNDSVQYEQYADRACRADERHAPRWMSHDPSTTDEPGPRARAPAALRRLFSA